MKKDFDADKTLEIAKLLQNAKIGQQKKISKIISKLKKPKKLTDEDIAYFTSLTKVYARGRNNRTKIFHVRLNDNDSKPPCEICGEQSSFYCNMNDQYFCPIHLVGHDENEI